MYAGPSYRDDRPLPKPRRTTWDWRGTLFGLLTLTMIMAIGVAFWWAIASLVGWAIGTFWDLRGYQ